MLPDAVLRLAANAVASPLVNELPRVLALSVTLSVELV